jgi:hypothetical protein
MEIWKAGKDVTDRVSDLIKNYHPHLVIIEDEIGVIFREKASEVAGTVILGKTKKVPPLISVLSNKKISYRFLIEIGADVWATLTMGQQTALLDHHLCSMVVEEDPTTGAIKCQVRPPDFQGYRDEVERHGMWRPSDGDSVSAIEQAFGTKKAPPRVRSNDNDGMLG